MIVAFAKNKSLVGYIIRFFTWSRWNHCGALTKDGKYVIEATASHGVTKTTVAEFKSRYSTVHFAKIACDADKAQSFLLSQIGKKYDWMAIAALVLRVDFDRNDKWYCFELVAAATQLFRTERGSRITGSDLWAISKDIK